MSSAPVHRVCNNGDNADEAAFVSFLLTRSSVHKPRDQRLRLETVLRTMETSLLVLTCLKCCAAESYRLSFNVRLMVRAVKAPGVLVCDGGSQLSWITNPRACAFGRRSCIQSWLLGRRSYGRITLSLAEENISFIIQEAYTDLRLCDRLTFSRPGE